MEMVLVGCLALHKLSAIDYMSLFFFFLQIRFLLTIISKCYKTHTGTQYQVNVRNLRPFFFDNETQMIHTNAQCFALFIYMLCSPSSFYRVHLTISVYRNDMCVCVIIKKSKAIIDSMALYARRELKVLSATTKYDVS